MTRSSLVMGASGFLGSHITRQLAERGDMVRVWTRPSSSTRAFDDLEVMHYRSELHDDEVLREAMRGVDVVYHCVVDARAWLRDPAVLFATNVDGLRHVLDAAVATGVRRFVFCSTVGTIARSDPGPATEEMTHNWQHLGGSYIRSRIAAEDLVQEYVRERGLDAVVLCVSTTYGPLDLGPSPHGALVAAAARGKMPVYVRNQALEIVGIEDAARAFLLAAEHGRPGERYIVSERMMSSRELLTVAAHAVGAKGPRVGVPLTVMRIAGAVGDVVSRLFHRDVPLTSTSVRLMHVMSSLDHGKATRELGWQPAPAAEAVAAAATWYAGQD